MPSKSVGSRQGKQSHNIKKFRHDVARLKALGLISKRVDARSQRETRYMRGQVKRFADVLEGRAKAVKVPRGVAKEYSEAYRRKGNRIVVPVDKTETVFYSAKSKRVTATRPGYEPGTRMVKEFLKSGEVRQPLPEGYVYTIPLGGGVRRFDTWDDVIKFMSPNYETGSHRYHGALGDWRNYLMVERAEDADYAE